MVRKGEHEGQSRCWRLEANASSEDIPDVKEAEEGHAAQFGDSARLGGANPDVDLAQATISYYLVFSIY